MHHMCLKNAGMRALIVRKTAASLTSTALVTFKEHVAAESLLRGDVVWYGGSSQEAAQYRYSNGATITIGGMDRNTRIMSSEYDLIYVQEATELTRDDWDALNTRLRNGAVSFQQLMADCNPSTPTHWLKQRCEAGQTVMLESTHRENPIYYTADGRRTAKGEAYLSRLDALGGVMLARLRDGLWVGAEGQIYDEYEPAMHVVKPFEVPQDWQRFWAIDWGYVAPAVLQWWAEDPDGRLHMYRELYHTHLNPTDVAEQALRAVTQGGRWIEPKPRAIITDHGATDRATFERALGLSTTLANKEVLNGIQAVQRRMRPGVDGRPRVSFAKGATIARDPALVDAKKPTSTVEEIPGYIWDIGAGKQPKEQPVKENDHGCDALRYMVAYRDLQARSGFRGWND
jgi:phage terminase large subunit